MPLPTALRCHRTTRALSIFRNGSAAMAASSSLVAGSSAVREPSDDQMRDLVSMEAVFDWAGLPGELACCISPAGALLAVLGGGEQMTMAEFASIAPTDLNNDIGVWRYSSFYSWQAARDAGYEGDVTADVTRRPRRDVHTLT